MPARDPVESRGENRGTGKAVGFLIKVFVSRD
jgi:hypothetical protein